MKKYISCLIVCTFILCGFNVVAINNFDDYLFEIEFFSSLLPSDI